MNRRSFLAPLMAVAMVTAPMLLTPAPAAAQTSPTGLLVGIFQTLPQGGTFVGSLTVTSFQVIDGVLNAVGTVSGTHTGPAGATHTITNVPVTIPITDITGTCRILNLRTGIINLSVLGLNIHLAPVHLVITAVAGPGLLLGNLLCTVVHLLDQGGPLSTLLPTLNQILGQIPIV
jgi:hypothetical protein